MPQSITHDFLFTIKAPPPTPPDGAMGTATITADKADHVVTYGETVAVTASVTGAVEVYADSPAGRIDLPPTGGTFSFVPRVSGPFPLVVIDAAGGKTVKPMSVIVKYDRPALDPTAPPTLTTVQNGPLDDPATWGGRLPTADETVEVKHGCTYSGRKFWCGRLINTGAIVVRGGVLHTTDYDDRGVGALNLIGEGVDKALVMLHNRPRHPNDTADFWRCAWVRGWLKIRGNPTSRRHELAAPARVGDTRIVLTTPCVGWKVGHKVLLPDTRRISQQDDAHREEEIVVVRGVSADGLTVHLLAPVRFDHLPCLEKDGSVAFRPKALHLIANAGFLTSDPTDVATRCCVRVEGKAHLDMDNWLIHGTGRHSAGPLADRQPYDNNPLGLHNLAGPAGGVGEAVLWPDGKSHPPQFRVSNGVSLDPPPVVPMGQSQVSWGVLLSNSHHGLVEGNVSFNWSGAGICCLDGNETRNLLLNNSSVCLGDVNWSENRWGFTNVAHASVGVWCRGPNNYLRGNFASGCYRGFVVAPYMRLGQDNMKFPAAPGEDPYRGQSVGGVLREMPLLFFEDNEAGGRVVNAMEMWGLMVDKHGNGPSVNTARSVVKGMRAWRVRDHVYYNYMTSYVTFEDTVAREGGLAFFSSDYMAYKFQLKNVDVRGFNGGWLVGPLYDQSLDGGYFECFTAVTAGPLWVTGMSAQNVPPRRLDLRGLRWLRPPGTFPADWGAPSAVRLDGRVDTNTSGSNVFNLAGKNEVYVADFQGVAGDNFRAYFPEQLADAVMPATKAQPNSAQLQVNGCPEEGLTNAQSWAKYGIAWGGAVVPAGAAEREGVLGLVVPL